MPMLLPGGTQPRHPAGSPRFGHPSAGEPGAGRHDQGLTQRVGVPRRGAPGSKVTAAAAARAGSFAEIWIDADRAGDQSAGPLAGGL